MIKSNLVRRDGKLAGPPRQNDENRRYSGQNQEKQAK